MFNWKWITASGTELLMVLLTSVGIFVALLIFARIAGLRSFSKMSSFDYPVAVAFGSIIATTLLSKDASLALGIFGLAVLFLLQYLVAKVRGFSDLFEKLIDNEPMLLMAREEVLPDNLSRVRMTEDDLRALLRKAGITHPRQVLAVILETTGDVSVMRDSGEVDPSVFKGVRGAESLAF